MNFMELAAEKKALRATFKKGEQFARVEMAEIRKRTNELRKERELN